MPRHTRPPGGRPPRDDPAADRRSAGIGRAGPPPEFSRPLRTARLARDGADLSARATDAEREALARRFGVSEVRVMAVEARIEPDGDGWVVRGAARARLVQPCVVTLEPVVQRIDESFVRRFLPGAPPPDLADLDPEEEEDPPEPLGAVIDPAEMAAEAVALAIDPYPRRPDAVFDGAAAAPAPEGGAGAAAGEEPDGGPEAPHRPFAGLAALRAKLDRDAD